MKDISKLPKWAQEEIQTLKRQVEEKTKSLQKALGSLSGELEDTPYYMANPDHITYRPLPTSSIRIKFKKGGHIIIHEDLNDDAIKIFGSDGLSVSPYASNHIALRIRK